MQVEEEARQGSETPTSILRGRGHWWSLTWGRQCFQKITLAAEWWASKGANDGVATSVVAHARCRVTVGVEAVLGAGRAELGVVWQGKGAVHSVVEGTEAGALGQLGLAGARLQTACISGGRRVAAEGMVKRSLAVKDGSGHSWSGGRRERSEP